MRYTTEAVKKGNAPEESVKSVERMLERNGANFNRNTPGLVVIEMQTPGLRSLGAIDFLTKYCSTRKNRYVWFRKHNSIAV